jgi:hypothetical protein
MAVTSIWAVKGWLGKVVIYVENPEKTDNPAFFEKQGMTEHQAQGLSDVIDYAAQAGKTQAPICDKGAEVMRRFVSGINCRPAHAREEMLAIKSHFGKTDGVIAYHGYQSFAPNEVTPETAHEIGIKLAEKLWGERFQVIVATHLDKSNHLHNHFVLNNVSMIDGKKYYRSERDYHLMQQESDALCREYGLSVIENPERGKSKRYAEHSAERGGHPTWRGLVKSDVDAAIRRSTTERQFFENLAKTGLRHQSGQGHLRQAARQGAVCQAETQLRRGLRHRGHTPPHTGANAPRKADHPAGAAAVNGKCADKRFAENKILTQNVRIGFDAKKHRRNLNVMVVGGSGAGKTRNYVKPSAPVRAAI